VTQAENRVSEAEKLINLLQKEVDKLEGLTSFYVIVVVVVDNSNNNSHNIVIVVVVVVTDISHQIRQSYASPCVGLGLALAWHSAVKIDGKVTVKAVLQTQHPQKKILAQA